MTEEPRMPENPAAREEPSNAESAGSDPGESTENEAGVLTRVCIECGKEYYFTDGQPPPSMICERCGNKIFRDFYSPEATDDAARDFVDSTDRDLDTDDPEGDVMEGDILDLNRD